MSKHLVARAEPAALPGGVALLKAQLRQSAPYALVALSLSLAALVGAATISYLTGDPLELMTRDPAAVGGLPFYTGIISMLGVMCWMGAATLWLFSGTLLPPAAHQADLRRMALGAGGLSLMLMADDAFQIHEKVFPGLGLSEELALALYALAALAFVVRCHRAILTRTNVALGGLAAAFMAGSVLSDALLEYSSRQIFIEDGFKFMGTALWLAYAAATCATALAGRAAPEGNTTPSA